MAGTAYTWPPRIWVRDGRKVVGVDDEVAASRLCSGRQEADGGVDEVAVSSLGTRRGYVAASRLVQDGRMVVGVNEVAVSCLGGR